MLQIQHYVVKTQPGECTCTRAQIDYLIVIILCALLLCILAGIGVKRTRSHILRMVSLPSSMTKSSLKARLMVLLVCSVTLNAGNWTSALAKLGVQLYTHISMFFHIARCTSIHTYIHVIPCSYVYIYPSTNPCFPTKLGVYLPVYISMFIHVHIIDRMYTPI